MLSNFDKLIPNQQVEPEGIEDLSAFPGSICSDDTVDAGQKPPKAQWAACEPFGPAVLSRWVPVAWFITPERVLSAEWILRPGEVCSSVPNLA